MTTPIADKAVRDAVTANADRHQFLGAGAGSGKTTTLVDHYLHLLSEGDIGPHNIIAVTFTNKAAAEMKARLREECRKLAEADPAGRWPALARDIETAPVETIHSLCSRILRESAIAARLDPGFAVLEGTDASLMLESCVERSLLDRLGQDCETAARLVLSFGLQRAGAAIGELINTRVQFGWVLADDSAFLDAEKLLEWWADQVGVFFVAGVAELLGGDEWKSAFEAITTLAADKPDDKLELKRQPVAEVMFDIAAAAQSGANAETLAALLARLQNCESAGNSGIERNWPDAFAFERVKVAMRSFTTQKGEGYLAIQRLNELAPHPETDPEAARLTSALVVETRAALTAYQKAKRERSALDFEDLLLATRDLWRASPSTLARYQTRVRHLMVDEFQDTNSIQKDILWPLAEGGAKLFVVGDAKQSIYRFRNADVTVFDTTRRETATGAGAVDELTVNFRSSPAVVALFNELFRNPAVMGEDRPDRKPFEAAYSELTAHREHRDATDDYALEVCVIQSQRDAGEADAEDGDAEEVDTTGLREAEAAWIAGRIGALIAAEHPVYDKRAASVDCRARACTAPEIGDDGAVQAPALQPAVGGWRPAQPGDFALLFHAMRDVGRYEHALRDAGLPYYVVAGRGFYARQEVRDVVNCLATLENNLDEVALIGVLRSPMFALSDETLFWLAQTPGPWWQRLQTAAVAPPAEIAADERSKVAFAAATLGALRADKNRLGLAGLVNAVVERTGLSATLAAQFGGEQMVSNLRKLADIAGEFEQSGHHSLRAFIEYITTLQVREEREGQAPTEEEGGDSIKLMTVHASKGLEWPIVFVPDLARQRPGDSGGFRAHPKLGIVACEKDDEGKASWPGMGAAIKAAHEEEDLAERRRQFYVAVTRARDLLVLSASHKLKQDGTWSESLAKRPLGWLNEGLGQPLAQNLGGYLLAGEGWTGRLTITTPAGVSRPEPEARGRATKPLIETLDLADDVAVPGVTPAQTERLLRRAAPIAPDFASRQRFTATELATYLQCPRRYRLQVLDGLPSQEPRLPALDGQEELSATERGTVVHHILRLVGTGGREALAQVVGDNLGLEVSVAIRAEKAMTGIRATVERFLDHPLYARLMADAQRLRTEMTVAFVADSAVLEGKIDALVESADGSVHILDYKTGRPGGDDQPGYRFQVGLYCKAVEAALERVPAGATIVHLTHDDVALTELAPGEDGAAALQQATAAVTGIRAGQFERREGKCGECRLAWACDGAE